MTYAIIALVVVAAVVIFLLATQKPKGKLPSPSEPRPLEGAGAAGADRRAPRADAEAPKPGSAAELAKPVARRAPVGTDVTESPSAAAPTSTEPVGPSTVVEPSARAAPAAEGTPTFDVPGLRKGLAKSRSQGGFLGRLAQLFAGKRDIDPGIADQIEEILLSSDVGVATTKNILGRIREALGRNELANPQAVWDALRAETRSILSLDGGRLRTPGHPTVVFVVGVNGVGKTTSIGKIATKLKAEGKSVLLAAGDTFRAAAVQQLEIWGKRVGCEVVKGKEGADPAAVIFDAVQKAKASNVDVVLADSAGRLQTKSPLMDELKKIVRTMQKALDDAPHETLLVLDATNGQNATSQARMFREAIPITGIILTKLDGTAKGGVILGICDELKMPVRYVGIGERAEDLREFIADEFVDALFGTSADETAAA